MTSHGDSKVVYQYSLVNEKTHIFLDNWKTIRDNIIKLGIYMYNGITNMALQIVWIVPLMTSSGPKIGQNFELE